MTHGEPEAITFLPNAELFEGIVSDSPRLVAQLREELHRTYRASEECLAAVTSTDKRSVECTLPSVPLATAVVTAVDLVSALHSTWDSDERYLDSDLRPRVLQVFGALPSFESLCARHHIASDCVDILVTLSEKLFNSERLAHGQIRFVSRMSMLHRSAVLFTSRLVTMHRMQMHTLFYNYSTPGDPHTRILDRTYEYEFTDDDGQHFLATQRKRIEQAFEPYETVEADQPVYARIAGVSPQAGNGHAKPKRLFGITVFGFMGERTT